MATALRLLQQGLFLSQPLLTEENISDQTGKAHIVTGGYSGVGYELVKILYLKHATIYSAGRSRVVETPRDTSSIGTNCLGPFLFTSLLIPVLNKTAASSPTGTVRVTWAASSAIELSPKGGVEFELDGTVKIHDDPQKDYCQSKAGNVLLAFETARRYGGDGIVSVAWNLGNLQSDLYRHMSRLPKWIMEKTWLHLPVFGAHTTLFAGWSGDIIQENNGAYIIPWGRFGKLRADIEAGKGRTEGEENGPGAADRFWEGCVRSTKPYV